MKLITKAIENQLAAAPLYSQDEKNASDVKVIAKFFNAYGTGTWYITEGDKHSKSEDYLFFGLCSIHEAELGYVRLSDLKRIKGIERDLHWSGTLADAQRIESVRGRAIR